MFTAHNYFEGLQVFTVHFCCMIYRIMEWNGGITLAELNRKSQIKIYLSCSTKPRWNDLDLFLKRHFICVLSLH